ncbi:yippee-like 1 [Circinella umbellata]|nr:yippee-like 1 [Circinella umbellata]
MTNRKQLQEHQAYLTNVHNRVYTCANCHCDITTHAAIMSRAFQGRHGPGYLVGKVVNVTVGVKEERLLMTGVHTVADISCMICRAKLGWKYLRAREKPQKYKEGRYIVEKSKLSRENIWSDDDDDGFDRDCY